MSLNMNKRVTYKRVRPNALIEFWVAEMYESARLKKSKLEPMLREALDSLSKYPVPLQSGAECMILKGFEKRLCTYLDLCLKHRGCKSSVSQCCDDDNSSRSDSSTSSSSSSLPFNKYIPQSNMPTPTSDINQDFEDMSFHSQNDHTKIKHIEKSHTSTDTQSALNSDTHLLPTQIDSSGTTSESTHSTNSDMKSGAKRMHKYKPTFRSGGYAILVALLEQHVENPYIKILTKEELIEKAQKHSEESFIRPRPESYYTAWANMSRLLKKGLVKKNISKKVEYLLTEEGIRLARELVRENENRPSINDIIFHDAPSTSAACTEHNTNIIDGNVPSTSQNIDNFVIEMPPGSFDIILVIDKNETGGVNKKRDPTVAQFNKYPDLSHEYRSLKVGDFTWIARHKVNKDQELVLPYIVERKRMDDLGASIRDGRFHEQKFRLRKCGLKNVIYLVENHGKNKHVGLPIHHLMQALANTRVQDGFKVHMTDSLTNSARYLAMLTKRLTLRFKDKQLRGRSNEPTDENLMTYEYFNKSSAKTKALTVTETFIKLLLQIKGVSVEKALAITSKYPTPRSLVKAYSKCVENEGKYLLAHLKYGGLGRNVGPIASRSIYQLFSSGNE